MRSARLFQPWVWWFDEYCKDVRSLYLFIQIWLYDIVHNVFRSSVTETKNGCATSDHAKWHSTKKTTQNYRASNMWYFPRVLSITNCAWIILEDLDTFHKNRSRTEELFGISLKMAPIGKFSAAPRLVGYIDTTWMVSAISFRWDWFSLGCRY